LGPPRINKTRTSFRKGLFMKKQWSVYRWFSCLSSIFRLAENFGCQPVRVSICAVLFTSFGLENLALGQNPPGCQGCTIALKIDAHQLAVSSGTTATFRISVGNPPPPPGGVDSCNISNVFIAVVCPGSDGTPATGVTNIIRASLNLFHPTDMTILTNDFPCTLTTMAGIETGQVLLFARGTCDGPGMLETIASAMTSVEVTQEKPPGCAGCTAHVSLIPNFAGISSGGVAKFQVQIGNPAPPPGDVLPCNLSNLSLIVVCPGPNGTLVPGVTNVLATNLSLAQPTPFYVITNDHPCTISTPVGIGLAHALAYLEGACQKGPGDRASASFSTWQPISHPCIAVTGQCLSATNSGPNVVVTYSVSVTNCGDTPLRDIRVYNSQPAPDTLVLQSLALAAGSATNLVRTYTTPACPCSSVLKATAIDAAIGLNALSPSSFVTNIFNNVTCQQLGILLKATYEKSPQERLTIAWPPSTNNLVLQFAESLPASNWSNIAQSPVFTNGNFILQLPVTNGARFFRLLTW
jgi:hypothetical protein